MTDDPKRVQLAQLIKMAEAELMVPANIEAREYHAKYARAKFLAYIKAGFTEAQAIELLKGQP